jgi:CIC family chloride channel protein
MHLNSADLVRQAVACNESSRRSCRLLNLLEQARAMSRRLLLVTLVITGALCGAIAVLFHELIDLMRSILIQSAVGEHSLTGYAMVIGIPTVVAGALAMVIERFAPLTGKANLARVRRAWLQDTRLLDGRSVIFTFLLTPISLGSGAPLGPEGPTVVVTSGFSVWFGQLLHLPKKVVRGMIPVGTAAGIAAIFNTPITGVVFALEEVLGTTSKGVLGGTIVAAVAAAVVERLMVGGHPLLGVPAAGWHDVRELIGFALVGVFAGVVSGLTIPAVLRLRVRLSEVIPSPVVRAATGGILFGAIGLLVPEILGVGYDTTEIMLKGEGSLTLAATAFVGKTVALVIALATGIVGGVFAPALFVGAALGSTVGQVAGIVFPAAEIQPGAYALVGMGAFFGGILRCPIASILIVFEITRDYNLILPLMLGVAISIAISKRLAPHSLTENQLEAEGFGDEAQHRVDPFAKLNVGDLMNRDLVPPTMDMTILDAARTIGSLRYPFYPIVDSAGRFVGVVSADSIDSAARNDELEEPVASRIEPTEMVMRESDSVDAMIQKMTELGLEHCPVLSSDGQDRVVGFVSPRDILRARIREGEKIRSLSEDLDVFGDD